MSTLTPHQLMLEAIHNATFPAAQLLVAKKGKIHFSKAYGQADSHTFFDIASLTKAISTASLCLLAFQENKLSPNTTLKEIFPESTLEAHQEITIMHLLEHTSGLPAWRSFYHELPRSMAGSSEAIEHTLQTCLRENIIHPVGSKSLYSDIGFLLLGFTLERIYQKNLAELFGEKIQTPLKLQNIFFAPFGARLSALAPQAPAKAAFAATQDCPWRGNIVRGFVDDANAYMLGGVAGHAGLFATAEALHIFMLQLREALQHKSSWLKPALLKELFCFERVKNRGDTFLCGWNLPSKRNSSAGKFFSKHSIGHLGFTGCSVWMDLEKDLWIILLSNRVHPSVNNQKITQFRPLLHDAVMQELAAQA